MEAADLLVDLDDDQRRAVVTESRLVAVIAGAGSGKTRVLTRRIAHRVLSGTAEASHTLALTFTREAAGELRRRLGASGVRERVEAGTFHSVALGLLRRRWMDTNRPVPTVVDDRARLLRAARGQGDGSGAERASASAVLEEVNWALARGLGPDDYQRAARTAGRRSRVMSRVPDALEAYAAEKRRRGVVDLDDLLAMLVRELEGDRSYAEATRWRFRHLLVDEAQDLNPLQHRLVDLLREGVDDLFLVGDPSQAIYGFNGTDPSLLVDVSDRFPGVEVIRLPVNHRSTPQIVAAGNHVLDGSGQGAGLVSARSDSRPVVMRVFANESEEAAAIATAAAACDPDMIRRGEVAVLARTHQVAGGLIEALETRGLRIRRRALASGSVERRLLDRAQRCPSASALRALAHDLLDDFDGDRVGDGLDGDRGERSPEEREATARVGEVLVDFLREQPHGDGTALRSWMATVDPFGVRDVSGVEVLTFHASKGREWPMVFVVGAEKGLSPHRAATTAAAVAEEARLLYVALTRATEVCVVSRAERRGGYRRQPSPFLDGFVSVEAEVAPPPPVRAVDGKRRREREVMARLERWRETAARRIGVLPSEFCSDAALRRIADSSPRDAVALNRATGLGAMTSERLIAGVTAALDGVD